MEKLRILSKACCVMDAGIAARAIFSKRQGHYLPLIIQVSDFAFFTGGR
jgi:hypothetical protein